MANELRAWWITLGVAALINVVLWLRASRAHRVRASSGSSWPRDVFDARRQQLWLSLVYVVVCGFRSFLPRADVQRICLVDSFLSSVLIGRTVATVAELCFAVQWALYIHELAVGLDVKSARRISWVLVPLIVGAETASWYAVVSRNFLGNTIEQSTWTFCGVLVIVSYVLIWPRAHQALRLFMLRTGTCMAAFVGFMCSVDVPMYFGRWRADHAAKTVYLGLQEGLHDAATRWVVEHSWPPWRPEATWMALYFSVGVWLSISLSLAPSARPDEPTPPA